MEKTRTPLQQLAVERGAMLRKQLAKDGAKITTLQDLASKLSRHTKARLRLLWKLKATGRTSAATLLSLALIDRIAKVLNVATKTLIIRLTDEEKKLRQKQRQQQATQSPASPRTKKGSLQLTSARVLQPSKKPASKRKMPSKTKKHK